jgi:hypothetical protein
VSTYVRFFHVEMRQPSFVVIELLVTLLALLAFTLLPVPPWPRACFQRFARRRLQACAAIFLLSILGRLALLPIEPFPPPRVQDEFSYLLASQTFAHGRLTNPTPPCWHHFEAFHVLLQPTYMSKYGAAAPLFMAFGERFLGTPRAGVLLSMALAAASLCWMLQAYLPAEWALLGGLLAVVRISWFSYFGNSYWGGSVAMMGGCLLLGGAARLVRRASMQDSLWMALGLVLLANARPFEGALLALPTCSYVLWRQRSWRSLLPGIALLLAGAVCTSYYCVRVTGHLTLPWVAHWHQWGMNPPFLFGKPNYAVRYQFPEQLTYNRDSDMFPYSSLKTKTDVAAELVAKSIYQWLFFIFPALTLPLILGWMPTLRSRRYRILVVTLAFECLGYSVVTWLQAHYFAVNTGIVYLILLNGLRWMHASGHRGLLRGTLASIAMMAAIRLLVVPISGFPTWATWMNLSGETPAWQDVHRIMEAKPGGQLVIVRYGKDHLWQNDWINNGYDIPAQHIIWARDTEPAESNLPLLCTFRDRQVWLLTPPEQGFVPPPDRTAPWDPWLAAVFLKPYPGFTERGLPAASPEENSQSGPSRWCPPQ